MPLGVPVPFLGTQGTNGLTLITILCRNLLKNTQFRQSKEKPLLYVGFQVMSVFLEMRRLILLQKMAFLSLLLH